VAFRKTSTLALGAVAVCFAFALATAPGVAAGQATTNDGIYSKAQADAAKPQFEEICAGCHAFSVAALKQRADLPLGDEPFLKKWEGRSIDELLTVIVTTMPMDGSAIINDDEALNLLAYVLQQNGFKAGAAPLTKEHAGALIARPAK
jgi:mono/diheme cytochrome c family protein